MNRDALLVYLRDLRDLELAKLRLLTAPDGKAASSLLQNAYDLNLVPASYRNLASIYYIYDTLSASPISMEAVLHPEQMAQHIPYILKKLHHTITEEHSALLHTRCQEAHQPECIAHTTQLLTDLEQASCSERERLQYAQIHALHQKTTAFFAGLM